MSVFQLQEWWSVKIGDNEEFDAGCMVVGNIDNASPPSDKIGVGSFQGMFRIYNPTKPNFRVEDLILEESLGLPIVQVLLGKFIPSTDILGVAILHPRKLVVYEVIPQGGKDGRVSYYTLRKAYQHDLGIEGNHFTAYNMTCGSFGGAKGREMFVVQSMDGKIQILEQSANAFSRQLADCLLPGPICYVPKIDAFVTVNHACQAECYRYQVLANSQSESVNKELNEFKSAERKSSVTAFGLTAIRTAMQEWSMNLGESCRQIIEGNFTNIESANKNNKIISELLMICDKSLFIIKSETGGVIQQKRLDRSDASCACIFPAISTNASGTITNFLLATQDATIQIYSNFQLIWAAKLPSTAVQMAVSQFGSQKGLIVTLDDEGNLAVNYLGTKPPHTALLTPMREMNYDKIDEEHRALLQIIRDAQNDSRSGDNNQSEKVLIKAQIPKSYDMEQVTDVDLPKNLMTISTAKYNSDTHIMKLCVRLYVTYNGEKPIHDVTIAISTPSFVHVVPKNIVLQKVTCVKSTPIMIKTHFYIFKNMLPSSLEVTVNANYQSNKGGPRVSSYIINLPLFMACKPKAPLKSALCKITLDTEVNAIPLTEVFDDLLYATQESGIDVAEILGGNAMQAMGFQLFTTVTNPAAASNLINANSNSSNSGVSAQLSNVVSVLVSKNAGRYRVQADSFPALSLIVTELERRLIQKIAPKDVNNAIGIVKCSDSIPMDDYFMTINVHFQTRVFITELNNKLNDLAQQYRLIQKRLLVRFKDKNPTPLGGLDFIMKETYTKILAISDEIQEQQQKLKQQALEIECFSKFIVSMASMKYNLSFTDRQLLHSYLCPEIKDGSEQGWEETVNASITYLLKTALAKNVKDSASLAGTTIEIPTSIEPLKKHLLLLMDRLEKGGKLSITTATNSGNASSTGGSTNTSNTGK